MRIEDDGLESVRAKLRRAEEHLNALRVEAEPWQDTSAYSFVTTRNADATIMTATLRIKSMPDFDRWALIAGDCAHNLRTALDHMVYCIAVREQKSNPPQNAAKLSFPISRGSSLNLTDDRMHGLSLEVRRKIERMQPYVRKHAELPPLLALLRDFDDADKHRLLQVAFPKVRAWDVDFLDTMRDAQPVIVEWFQGTIKDGTEILRLIFDRPSPYINYKLGVTLSVLLSHPPGPTGLTQTDVAGLLRLLDAEVREVIDLVLAAVV